jgi:hypothetical protein
MLIGEIKKVNINVLLWAVLQYLLQYIFIPVSSENPDQDTTCYIVNFFVNVNGSIIVSVLIDY